MFGKKGINGMYYGIFLILGIVIGVVIGFALVNHGVDPSIIPL